MKKIEAEIASQICLCELCFEICQSILNISDLKIETGFLPYYYNLNFTKGVLLLHSLLKKIQEKNINQELSIAYFFQKFREEQLDGKMEKEIAQIQKKIELLLRKYNKITPWILRHKIAAHLDSKFIHKNFTCKYLMPDKVENFIELTGELKEIFIKWRNYADGKPYLKPIKDQSDALLRSLTPSPH